MLRNRLLEGLAEYPEKSRSRTDSSSTLINDSGLGWVAVIEVSTSREVFLAREQIQWQGNRVSKISGPKFK